MKIKIKNSKQSDLPTDEEREAVEPVDELEDWEADRAPIDLDGAMSMQDAIEAASRPKRKAEKPAEAEAERNEALEELKAQAEAAAAVAASEIEKLKTENEETKSNYMRALADVQNMRRRTNEEIDRIKRNASERLIMELLPLVDDFELALGAAKQSESYEQLVSGVDAILRKFNDTLGKQGLAPIPSVGEAFDPDVHEAVMIDEESDLPDETVTTELRKGYTLQGRVLRPALVKVAKAG